MSSHCTQKLKKSFYHGAFKKSAFRHEVTNEQRQSCISGLFEASQLDCTSCLYNNYNTYIRRYI